LKPKTTITAGLRGAQWDPARVPSGVRTSLHTLATHDGASTLGVLYARGHEKTVACVMHPREFVPHHYLVPELLRAGVAAWVQAPRSVGNDLRLEHEQSLLEVAAGCMFLRSQGFEKVLLVGTSGGGPLYAFYNQQSLHAPGERLEKTPAGRPCPLREATMPACDGVVLVSAHLGQGAILLASIDGSVVDESDPFSVDAMLSPFAEQNGFAPPPISARYPEDFLARYRDAQHRRVQRLDEQARADVDARLVARRSLKDRPGLDVASRAAFGRIFTIWRTDADPRFFDLSLDPSERRYGSLWGNNPAQSNFGAIGFARVCTAESWLSSWSGLSSRATMARCAPSIEQPALYIHFTGDNLVFPADAARIHDWIRASDKSIVRVAGDHQGQSLGADYPNAREQVGAHLREWITARFPTHGVLA
jgi:hypothetical protein